MRIPLRAEVLSGERKGDITGIGEALLGECNFWEGEVLSGG